MVPLPAEPVEPLGEAEVGSCNDTGPPPSGVDIEEELERVTVSAYPGYDPRQVLAIPEPQGGVLALVSAELPRELWLQITAELQAAAGVE